MVNPDKLFGRLGNRMFQMAYIYSQMRSKNIPDLFVQDFEYFDKYESEIKQLFGEGIGFLPYVSIHVRRGTNPINPDEPKYSENPFYVNLNETDYYERAMALFPDKLFVIFSDDPGWCHKQPLFKGEHISIMEKGDELEDFNTMASCSSQIIANSSYSWWAAYLNPHLDKKVVYPKQWFSDGISRVGFPRSWIPL